MRIGPALRVLLLALLPSIIVSGCAPPAPTADEAAALAAVPVSLAAAGADWTSLGGQLASPPVVARNWDGKLEVFAVGTSGALFHRKQLAPGGDFSAWSSL